MFVLAVQDLHGLNGLRDSLSAANQNTVNVESENKRVGDGLLDGRRQRALKASDAGDAVAGS